MTLLQPFQRLPSADARGSTPDLRASLVFVLFLALLFLGGALPLQLLLGEGGLLAAEWLLLFLPSMIRLRASGFDVAGTLSLSRPTATEVAGALVLGAGALPLIWTVGWLQTFVLPIPWEVLEGLERLVTADSPGRLLWLLLVLAVTPAICEEVVFRGVLLGGSRSLAPWKAIVLNGAVFGAFHLSLSTVVRFLPTALLGCAIAWAVWRSRSLWTGVAMHLLNNATIVALASFPAFRDAFSDPRAPPPVPVIVAGGIAFAAGVGIILRTSSPAGDPADLTTTDP